MIIVQMMGNLGNQLFIYAMARSLQIEYGDEIVIDLGGLKRFYYSADYKLNHLNLPKEGISYDLEIIPKSIRNRYLRTSRLFHIEQKIYRTLRRDGIVPEQLAEKWFKKGCYYNFSTAYYDYPKRNDKVKFVYGYFQNEAYFERNADIIKKECRVMDEFDDYDKKIIPIVKECMSVAVSVRAINELGVSFIDFDYYYRAMGEISKHVDNPRFFVFSDDIEATKEKMRFPYPVEYVTPSDACHGLRIMYNCKHFVIANSTFSWWGAYLGDWENKVIIMPEKIDRNGIGREGYYIKGCIKIPNSFIDYKVDFDQIIHKRYAK